MSAYTIFSGYASAQTLQTIAAAVGYSVGNFRLAAVYTNVQYRDLGAIAVLNPHGYSGNAVFNTAEADVGYWVTPSLALNTSYVYVHGAPVSGGTVGRVTYHQASASVDYFLSKVGAPDGMTQCRRRRCERPAERRVICPDTAISLRDIGRVRRCPAYLGWLATKFLNAVYAAFCVLPSLCSIP